MALRKGQVPLEVMVHPIMSPDGCVVDRLENRALNEIVAEFGPQTRFVSFREINT